MQPSYPLFRFFQIFYTTHLMYYAFFVLLILHAPVFWKCILAPGVIFIVEKVRQKQKKNVDCETIDDVFYFRFRRQRP